MRAGLLGWQRAYSDSREGHMHRMTCLALGDRPSAGELREVLLAIGRTKLARLAVVFPSELPWPAMAVDRSGDTSANRSLKELLGVEDLSPASLFERFEIARFGGG